MALDDMIGEHVGETFNHNGFPNGNGITNGNGNGNGVLSTSATEIAAIADSQAGEEECPDGCDCDFCYGANDLNFKADVTPKIQPWYSRYSGYGKIATGTTLATFSSFQHCYYYWSHDFAHNKMVSVPLWYPELKFTGYEWEVMNFFGGEVVSIVAMAAAGALLAQGVKHLDDLIDRHKDCAVRKEAKAQEYKKLIETALPEAKSKLEEIEARYDHPDDKRVLMSTAAEERIYTRKHPWRAKLEKMLSHPAAVPATLAAHSGIMFAIYDGWHNFYFNNKVFLTQGDINLTYGMAWNYAVIPSLITLWFVGLATYYFWKTPVKAKDKGKDLNYSDKHKQ